MDVYKGLGVFALGVGAGLVFPLLLYWRQCRGARHKARMAMLTVPTAMPTVIDLERALELAGPCTLIRCLTDRPVARGLWPIEIGGTAYRLRVAYSMTGQQLDYIPHGGSYPGPYPVSTWPARVTAGRRV